MKKMIFTIFIFLLPFYIYAYSKNIIPGGESIGLIKLSYSLIPPIANIPDIKPTVRGIKRLIIFSLSNFIISPINFMVK